MQMILVRHGETQWNAGEIFRGRADVPLNETGLAQAALLADYLAGYEMEAVYTSPLQRACKTAEIVASRQGLAVRLEPGLLDLDFGEWEGKPVSIVQEGYPELWQMWSTAPEKIRFPAGGGLEEVRQRAVQTVNDVIARHGGTVVLVSHRVVLKVLMCHLLGLDNSHFWNIRLDTCGLTTFVYDNGRFILTGHNNTSFLESLKQGKAGDF
jgi:broad specificity phosphatase PhoE